MAMGFSTRLLQWGRALNGDSGAGAETGQFGSPP